MGVDDKTRNILNFWFRKLDLQISQRIKNDAKLAVLWLLWHYSFLQGFFYHCDIRFPKMLVLRCDPEMWHGVADFFQVNQKKGEGVEIISFAKEFDKSIANRNDEPFILFSGDVTTRNEARARRNIEFMKLIMKKSGSINEIQKIFPIFFVEEMVPPVGLMERDYYLLDLKEEDFYEGGFWRRILDLQENICYVENVVKFMEENQEVLKNHIEREKVFRSYEKRMDVRTLYILSSVVAYIMTKTNIEESYEHLRDSFWQVVNQFVLYNENCIANGDVVEIFRMQILCYLRENKVTGVPRKAMPDLDVDYICCFDDEFFYFRREFLESICQGELREIPFVRVLRQLDEGGFLKGTGRTENNFTSVVNLIDKKTGNYRSVRMLAIKKTFFIEIKRIDLQKDIVFSNW